MGEQRQESKSTGPELHSFYRAEWESGTPGLYRALCGCFVHRESRMSRTHGLVPKSSGSEHLLFPKSKAITLLCPPHSAEPGPVGGRVWWHTWLQIKALLPHTLSKNEGGSWLACWLHRCTEAQPPSGSHLAQRFLNRVGGWNDQPASSFTPPPPPQSQKQSWCEWAPDEGTPSRQLRTLF
jgi:hypothetical protein